MFAQFPALVQNYRTTLGHWPPPGLRGKYFQYYFQFSASGFEQNLATDYLLFSEQRCWL